MKDKFEFIEKLLLEPKLNTQDKERVLKLLVPEMKNVNNSNIEAKEEKTMLNNINDNRYIGNHKTEKTTEKREFESNKSFLPPRPNHTLKLLEKFRYSDGLKYLTHDYPDPYNKIPREELIKIAKKEFDEVVTNYPNIATGLKRRVEEFAFSDTPEWFLEDKKNIKNYEFSWSMPAFIEWELTADIHPCESGQWGEFIDKFKRSVEIRDGDLLGIVEKCIKKSFEHKDLMNEFEFIYDKKNLKSARFYTDVDLFTKALIRVLRGNIKFGRENDCYQMEIKFETLSNGIKCITVIHFNSESKASIHDKFTDGGDFEEIMKNLWSLCIWSIEGKFSEGYYRKYLLNDDSIKEMNKPTEIQKNEVLGFTHKFMFY
jgi:hypothetical protein